MNIFSVFKIYFENRARNRLQKKLFRLLNIFAKGTETPIDDNVVTLIDKMISGEDYRYEVAELTRQLAEVFCDKIENQTE